MKPSISPDALLRNADWPKRTQDVQTPLGGSDDHVAGKSQSPRIPATAEEQLLVSRGHGVIICRSCQSVVERCRCFHGHGLIRGYVDDCKKCRKL